MSSYTRINMDAEREAKLKALQLALGYTNKKDAFLRFFDLYIEQAIAEAKGSGLITDNSPPILLPEPSELPTEMPELSATEQSMQQLLNWEDD